MRSLWECQHGNKRRLFYGTDVKSLGFWSSHAEKQAPYRQQCHQNDGTTSADVDNETGRLLFLEEEFRRELLFDTPKLQLSVVSQFRPEIPSSRLIAILTNAVHASTAV